MMQQLTDFQASLKHSQMTETGCGKGYDEEEVARLRERPTDGRAYG